MTVSPDRRKYVRGNPDTLTILAALASVGLLLIFTASPPPTLVRFTSFTGAMIWTVITTMAALVAFVGVLWRDELIGWVLELGARITLTLTAGAYSLTLAVTEPSVGVMIVLAVFTALCVASGWRVWQLVRRLNEWKAFVGDVRRGSPGGAV